MPCRLSGGGVGFSSAPMDATWIRALLAVIGNCRSPTSSSKTQVDRYRHATCVGIPNLVASVALLRRHEMQYVVTWYAADSPHAW